MSDERDDEEQGKPEENGDAADGGVNDPLTQRGVEAPRAPFEPASRPEE